MVFSEWLRTGLNLKSELPFTGSVAERDLAGSFRRREIFVYAVAYLCSDSSFIFSAIFQVVNHCITIERKKKNTSKNLISNSFHSLSVALFSFMTA